MDSETIARDRYVEALRRLDPGRPADDGEIVARPGWDRFREVSLQARAGTRFRYALHGSVGVGKTTELLAWRTRLSAMGVKAAYVAFHPRAHQLHQLLKGKASEGAQVLLVDGLDLQQNEAETWFGPGTVLVDAELPALVAVAPAVVGRWPADKRDPKLTLVHLPPFPVLGRDQHAAWAAVDVLADGLRSRLAGVEGLLEKPGLVKRIALMSGGVPRDAVRILRGAVLSAARRGGPVSMADVVAGEREVRQDLEQAFVRGDVEALRYVFNERRFVEHDPRLLTMGAVVQYEDEEGTYALPHPLLWAGIGVDHSLRTEAVVAGNAP